MRGPTLLLFSLVLGAAVLTHTASRLQGLMDEGVLPGAASETPEPTDDTPSVAERATETLREWRDGAVRLYQRAHEFIAGPPGEEPVVITEDTVKQIWVREDEQGTLHFSREDPGHPDAWEILWPAGEPLPDEPGNAAATTAERADAGRHAEAEDADPTPDTDEPPHPETLELEDGLRLFREHYQRDQRQQYQVP